jgi:hypothetical protein
LAWSKRHKAPPKDLEEFLCQHYWLEHRQFAGCSDLFTALRIAGDDCFDFMREFSELFGVDLRTYDWSKYHFSEGEEMDLFGALRSLFGRALGRPNRSRLLLPISVAHLEKVLRDKRWSDPG